MTDSALHDFEPSSSRFYVTCSNLVICRNWCGDTESPALRVMIHGTAVSDEDDVCVIGAEAGFDRFHLTITSDVNAKAHWELLRANRKGHYEECDSPEYRVVQVKYERLDKSPATASLFVDDRHEGYLECQVSLSTLEQLERDIADGRVGTVKIGIEWEFGLVKQRGLRMGPTGPLFGKTWGLFTVQENHSPEGLDGHVQLVTWNIIDREAEATQCEGNVGDGKPHLNYQRLNQQEWPEAILHGPLDRIARSVRVIMWVVIVAGIGWMMR